MCFFLILIYFPHFFYLFCPDCRHKHPGMTTPPPPHTSFLRHSFISIQSSQTTGSLDEENVPAACLCSCLRDGVHAST